MDTSTNHPVEEKKQLGAAKDDETDREKKADEADPVQGKSSKGSESEGDDVNDFIVARAQPINKRNMENGSLGLANTSENSLSGLANSEDSRDAPDPVENPEADHVDNCITNPPGSDDKTATPVSQEFGFKGVWSIIIPLISIFVFLYDIYTDVALLVEYYIEGEKIFFYLTLAFLVVPGILVIGADLTFLWLDYSHRKKKRRDDNCGQGQELMDLSQNGRNESMSKPEITDSSLKIFARVVLALMSLGIVVRIMQHIYYKIKKRTDKANKDYYKERVVHTKRDYALLSFMFAFTETYAQAALQLYIFTSNPVSLLNSRIGRSIISSVVFMPLAFVNHYRSMRIESFEGDNKKSDMAFIVYVFYFLGVQGAMMFRIVSIALFLAAVPILIGVPLVNLHFVCVFLWLACYHQPSFEGLLHRNKFLRTAGKYYYIFLYSVTSMLFSVDLYNEKKKDRVCFPSKKQNETGETERVPVRSSKWRMLGYNIVLYTESAVFIGLGSSNDNVDLPKYAMVLLSGFLMHLVFIGNYYLFLHPSIGQCYNCTDPQGQDCQQPLNDNAMA